MMLKISDSPGFALKTLYFGRGTLFRRTLMHASLRWAAPALLFALAVGCGRDPSPSKKGPSAETPKTDATPAIASANLVTLKVDGMV
jgi:hypothetical protein